MQYNSFYLSYFFYRLRWELENINLLTQKICYDACLWIFVCLQYGKSGVFARNSSKLSKSLSTNVGIKQTQEFNHNVIKSSILDVARGIVEFKWSNGETYNFSSIYLRDNCRCTKCFNSVSKQRLIDTCREIPIDITPSDVLINDDYVNVIWPDGHETVFNHTFLWERRQKLKHDSKNESFDISRIKPNLWTSSDLEGKIPTFNLDVVLNNEEVRYLWFKSLCQYGVTLFSGAEKELGELERVKLLFGGYFKSSHYGWVQLLRDLYKINIYRSWKKLFWPSLKRFWLLRRRTTTWIKQYVSYSRSPLWTKAGVGHPVLFSILIHNKIILYSLSYFEMPLEM